jgi:ribosomal protein L23
MHLEEVLIKPLLTEKSSVATEETNRYAFLSSKKCKQVSN